MGKLFSLKNFYLLIALLSILTLISAVYIEYVLDIKPCKLCLYQRIPYIIAIFLCFFGYGNFKKLLWGYLLILTFVISLILSGYHAGIENDIFQEFSGCSANNLNIIDKAELLNSLNEKIPNCKDIGFRMLGLSLATINFIISIIVIVISVLIIKNEKNR